MKVVVPCCGRSSRFPDLPPKWMLPAPDGRRMLALAVAGLEIDPADLVVVVLADHVERFGAERGIRAELGDAVQVVVLDEPTGSQVETVSLALRALDLREPFLVKDCDNAFVLGDLEQPTNYVSVDSLHHHELVNPGNKSYLEIDHNGAVLNIREKVVVSDVFSVGGYFFTDPRAFLDHVDRLGEHRAEWTSELYISDVIGSMILDGIPFRSREVARYADWGTIHEWHRAMATSRTYFVLVDGYLLEQGSAHFRPRFDEVRAHPEAVAAVRELAAQGHELRYLSVRPAELAALTREQLGAAGLPDAPIVFGCPTTAWTLVTAPRDGLRSPSAISFELDPADGRAAEKLRDDR